MYLIHSIYFLKILGDWGRAPSKSVKSVKKCDFFWEIGREPFTLHNFYNIHTFSHFHTFSHQQYNRYIHISILLFFYTTAAFS